MAHVYRKDDASEMKGQKLDVRKEHLDYFT
jgi:hypothetical protein